MSEYIAPVFAVFVPRIDAFTVAPPVFIAMAESSFRCLQDCEYLLGDFVRIPAVIGVKQCYPVSA